MGDVSGHPGSSLYVRLAGARAGKWTDAATGEHGDLLDLIALNRGLSFRDALAEARAFLRLPLATPRLEPMPASPSSPEAARRLFAASRPIDGTLAERYLAQRGIMPFGPLPALRFHPHCYYRGPAGRQSLPAIIAAVTDLSGRLTGLHRTWLDPSGRRKAAIAQPRRAMGHLLGPGVRFGAAGPVMLAGEGIETTLTVRMILPGLPMVAALSAGHLAALLFPPDLRRLYVIQDQDAAGEWALERLARRGLAAGIDIRPLRSRQDDFNADLLADGLSALRARVARQLHPDDAGCLLS